jgi:hypothetical protein
MEFFICILQFEIPASAGMTAPLVPFWFFYKYPGLRRDDLLNPHPRSQ